MSTRRPRGGRGSWPRGSYRGRSSPYSRSPAHYQFQPPRDVANTFNINHGISLVGPDSVPQVASTSTPPSVNSISVQQPQQSPAAVNSQEIQRPSSPKPLMEAVCNTGNSVDQSLSPTDEYLYGLDSSESSSKDTVPSLLGKRKGGPPEFEEDGERKVVEVTGEGGGSGASGEGGGSGASGEGGGSGDGGEGGGNGEGSDGGDRSKEGVAGDGGGVSVQRKGDQKKANVNPPVVPVQITEEEKREVNKQAIGVVGNISNEQFVCSLCLAQLNSKKNLQKHIFSNEHVRRVTCLLRDDLKTAHSFCEVCYVKCLSADIYTQHKNGKKHVKNVNIAGKIKQLNHYPIGPLLDQLLKEDVAQEGDGLSLGLSPTMMKFFSLPGPFIGLQYAEEVGTPGESNPKYNCTLCKVVTDAGNLNLHFTSSTHRLSVLRQDYPEKHRMVKQLVLSSDKKSELSGRLKDIAAEIEAREGRKVELIKRKILKPPKDPFSLGPSPSSDGAFSTTPVAKRARGAPPRGRGLSQRGRGWESQSQPSYVSDTPPQRGGYQERGRGRGGYQERGRGGHGGYQERGRGGRGGYQERGRGGYGGYQERGRGYHSNRGTSNESPSTSTSNYYDFSFPSSNNYTGSNNWHTTSNPYGAALHRGHYQNSQGQFEQRNEFPHPLPSPVSVSSAPYSFTSNFASQVNPPRPPLAAQPLMSFAAGSLPQTPSSFSSPLMQFQPSPAAATQQSPTVPSSFSFTSPSFQFQQPRQQRAPAVAQQSLTSPTGQWPTTPQQQLQQPLIVSPSPVLGLASPPGAFKFPPPPSQVSTTPLLAPNMQPQGYPSAVTHNQRGQPLLQQLGAFDQSQFKQQQQLHVLGGGGGGGQVHGTEAHLQESLQKLASAQIENEDDAEKALQLSSALTQALLAYRIKKVSSSSNPISSLLSTLHAVQAMPLQISQQHEHNPALQKPPGQR